MACVHGASAPDDFSIPGDFNGWIWRVYQVIWLKSTIQPARLVLERRPEKAWHWPAFLVI